MSFLPFMPFYWLLMSSSLLPSGHYTIMLLASHTAGQMKTKFLIDAVGSFLYQVDTNGAADFVSSLDTTL